MTEKPDYWHENQADAADTQKETDIGEIWRKCRPLCRKMKYGGHWIPVKGFPLVNQLVIAKGMRVSFAEVFENGYIKWFTVVDDIYSDPDGDAMIQIKPPLPLDEPLAENTMITIDLMDEPEVESIAGFSEDSPKVFEPPEILESEALENYKAALYQEYMAKLAYLGYIEKQLSRTD